MTQSEQDRSCVTQSHLQKPQERIYSETCELTATSQSGWLRKAQTLRTHLSQFSTHTTPSRKYQTLNEKYPSYHAPSYHGRAFDTQLTHKLTHGTHDDTGSRPFGGASAGRQHTRHALLASTSPVGVSETEERSNEKRGFTAV